MPVDSRSYDYIPAKNALLIETTVARPIPLLEQSGSATPRNEDCFCIDDFPQENMGGTESAFRDQWNDHQRVSFRLFPL